MMNTKRILVATNLSHKRDTAFDRGLAIARTTGAELYLLHAVPPHQPFSLGGLDRLRRTADLRRRAARAGVPFQAVEQHGDPAEIIGLHASTRAVDLVVMGAERNRKPKWLRRASLTERVLQRSTTPTLIVPADEHLPAA
jgi:nucleotide-binding universal stress UspA family protein